MRVVEALAILVVGLTAGCLYGAFGAGGAAFATPVLALAGVPAALAVASPLPAMIPAAIVSARSHLRHGTLDRRVAALAVAGGLPGTLLGALASSHVDAQALLGLSALLLLVVGLRVLLPDPAGHSGRCAERRARTEVVVALAFAVGLLTGLLANGGGFLLVPTFVVVLGLTTGMAAGTSMVVAGFLLCRPSPCTGRSATSTGGWPPCSRWGCCPACSPAVGWGHACPSRPRATPSASSSSGSRRGTSCGDPACPLRSALVTVTGRGANLASNWLGPVARLVGRLHARLYRRFGGRRFTRWLGKPAFLLTVRGRKTGEPRSVMLMLVRRGDDLLVCGSNAGNRDTPQWYRNLMAAGDTSVQVGDDTWPVTVREVSGPERDECWALLCAAYPDFPTYQAHTDRLLPVAVLERS